MTDLREDGLKPLGHLFELELTYQPGLAAITSPEGRAGEYLGSGDGVAAGPGLQGAVRWDLYEVVGETRCQTNFAGVINTEDGAEIRFEASGLGLVPDRAQPNRWRIANAVRFETADGRYAWLNPVLALWDGEFDMNTSRHHYRLYAHDNGGES